MTRLSFLLAALSLTACNSAGQYPALAEADQEAFMGCWRQQGRGLCGPHSLEHMDCRRAYQANYAERPADERAGYLGELGCGMATPEIDAETAGSEAPVEITREPAEEQTPPPAEPPPHLPIERETEPLLDTTPENSLQNDSTDAT